MTKEEAKKEIYKAFEPAFANYIIRALEQAEPCEDAISREELNSKTYKMPNGMELIFEYDNKHLGNISLECMDMLMGIIEDSSHGKRE